MNFNEFRQAVIDDVKKCNAWFNNQPADVQNKYLADGEPIIKSYFLDFKGDITGNHYLQSHISTCAFNMD